MRALSPASRARTYLVLSIRGLAPQALGLRPLRGLQTFVQSQSRLQTVCWLAVISLLPVALTSFIWLEVIRGVASRAIDGSGHYAAAQIYDQSIFPDTFGWTNAYFAGMSLDRKS